MLPRWLRKPVRVFARLGSGDYSPPPFAATIATATFLSLSTIYGAYLGGQIPTFLQAVTARTGFAVDQVRVSGHHETSEIDILERLDLDGWTSLVGFNADAGARAHLPAALGQGGLGPESLSGHAGGADRGAPAFRDLAAWQRELTRRRAQRRA